MLWLAEHLQSRPMESSNINSQHYCFWPFDHHSHCSPKPTAFDTNTENGNFAPTGDWPSSNLLKTLNDDDISRELSSRDVTVPRSNSPVSSESSWTGEDENDSLFFSIERRLFNFLLSSDQTQLILPPLNARQRRVVHGIAHLMHLGHKTIPTTQHLRRIQIFKKNAPLFSEDSPNTNIGEDEITHRSSHVNIAEPSIEDTTSSLEQLHGNNNLAGMPDRARRMPKRPGGFPCRYPGCQKTFNRACDWRKHSKIHEPKKSHPYQCSQCNKKFLYQKDVKRHENTHLRKTTQVTSEEQSCPDDTLTDASASPLEKTNSLADFDGDCLFSSLPYLNSDEDKDVMSARHDTWVCSNFLADSDLNNVEDWLLHSTALDGGMEISFE